MPKRLIWLNFVGIRTHYSRHHYALHDSSSQAGAACGHSPSVIPRISAYKPPDWDKAVPAMQVGITAAATKVRVNLGAFI
jgi:hypothetical protein